jgi:hypothetical protein
MLHSPSQLRSVPARVVSATAAVMFGTNLRAAGRHTRFACDQSGVTTGKTEVDYGWCKISHLDPPMFSYWLVFSSMVRCPQCCTHHL